MSPGDIATLHYHHINFQCDNEGLVAAISKGSSIGPTVMQLLHSLWFFTHTLTSPLQLHTYQEQQTLLLTTFLVANRHQLASLTQPCLHSQLTYYSQSPILSPLKILIGLSSIPTSVPRKRNITSPDISTLLTQ